MLINKQMYGVSLLDEQKSPHATGINHAVCQKWLWKICMSLGIQQLYKVLTTINNRPKMK